MRQAWNFTAADFERHPVWIGVHNIDFDEPWYEASDEATFRPWVGELPAPADKGFVLVSATLEIADGTKYPGYFTVFHNPESQLSDQQPCIFLRGRQFNFWGGMFGTSDEERQAFHAAIGKPASAIFPIRFSANPNLALGNLAGVVYSL